MADTFITLNLATVVGGPTIATATDASGYNWQKVVVATDTAGTPSAINTANPLPTSQTGTATVGGVAASGGTNTGNPVKIGGAYNASPITLSNGQVGDAQLDSSGFLKVNIAAGAAAGGTSSTFGSAFPATGTAVGMTNGTNMVAFQADTNSYLKVNVAAGATQAVVDNSTGFTSGTSQALPIAGFYATSPTALTSGDFGIPLMAKTRQMRVVLDADSAANSGLTYYTLVAPAIPAATAVKTSAGSLAFIQATNISSATVWIKFFNTASGSVTLGTTSAVMNFGIPGNTAGAGMVVPIPTPFSFATAITYAVTGGVSLTDNTSITASTISLNFGYA